MGVPIIIMSRDFSLRLVLICSTTGEVSPVQFTLNSLPRHGSDLKKEIEIAHEIPSFAQTLTYGDPKTEITDGEKLNEALVRYGDTIWVTFTAKAECREVERVGEYLHKLTDALHNYLPIEYEDSLSATILNQAFSEGFAQLLRKVNTNETKRCNNVLFCMPYKFTHACYTSRYIMIKTEWSDRFIFSQ